MSKIERSAGVATGYPGLVAGGGREGATRELDESVEAAAALLRDTYGCDVTIRFNSDRLSGGAWLKTDEEDAIGRNADIGICYNLVDVARLRSLIEQYPDEDGEDTLTTRLEQAGLDPSDPPAFFLECYAHIGNRALGDPSIGTSMPDDAERRYAHVTMPSAEEALEFLRENAVEPRAPAPSGPRP